MAQATGYTCDGCGKFETCNKDLQRPLGWMLLAVNVGDARPNSFDLCSNKCLYNLAKERDRAERGSQPPQKSPETRAKMQASQLTNAHTAGKHADDPRPECPLCEAETAA